MLQIMTTLAMAVIFWIVSISAMGATKTYLFNDDHATVGFKIKHWEVITKTGFFETFQGSIRHDDKKIENSSVEVTIDAASIATLNKKRDEHLRSEEFFDVARYPKLSFKSTHVKAGKAPGEMKITGDLMIHGVTRSVILNAKITGKLVDDDSGKERLAFQADTKIDRRDYGIAWSQKNKAGVFKAGDEVDIFIDGATVKK